jgi:hypothetical protein
LVLKDELVCDASPANFLTVVNPRMYLSGLERSEAVGVLCAFV